jgi:hypothetical protein
VGSKLTGHDAGASASITVAAFTAQFLDGSVSYNAGATPTVTGLSYNTLYYVYCDDANFAGGAVSYSATTSLATALTGNGRIFVESITTPLAGGGDTSGNNDGGLLLQSLTNQVGWSYDWANKRTVLFDSQQSDWLISSYPSINSDDPMIWAENTNAAQVVVAVGGTGQLFHTRDGIWLAGAYVANGTLDNGGGAGVGGAVRIGTSNTNGSGATLNATRAWMDYSAGAQACFFALADVLATGSRRVRIGLGAGLIDATPKVGGAYFEYDSASSANWRVVTSASSTATVTTTGTAVAAGKREFLITRSAAGVKFYIRAGRSSAWTLLATHTTNIPTIGADPFFEIKTLAVAAIQMDVYHCTAAAVIED